MQFSEEPVIVNYTKDGYAFLKTDTSSRCGNCSSKTGCGSLSFYRFAPKINLRVHNTLDLKAGDSAIISLPTDKFLIGTLLVYMLPLLGLFLGAGLGKSFFSEMISIVGGLVGLLLGLLLVKNIISKGRISKQFEPKLIRRLIPIDAH